MSRLDEVRTRIHRAATAAGRSVEDIVLLAVSKKQPLERVRALIEAGHRRFGENYVDEALEKMARLRATDLEWHFIGPIQSNKTRQLAEHFDWVQSVDRAKIVRRLNAQRPQGAPPLNVLIQLNIDAEPQKSGCAPAELEALASTVAEAPRLRLRGLMAIPAPRTDSSEQAAVFARLQLIYNLLSQRYPGMDTLSAGMSADLEAAIAHGSTMVRVGTDLFGPRPD